MAGWPANLRSRKLTPRIFPHTLTRNGNGSRYQNPSAFARRERGTGVVHTVSAPPTPLIDAVAELMIMHNIGVSKSYYNFDIVGKRSTASLCLIF
jgi:hypothetical protein